MIKFVHAPLETVHTVELETDFYFDTSAVIVRRLVQETDFSRV